MQRKLMLGLVLSLAIATTGAFAQSGSKGSSSKSGSSSNNASVMAKKQAKMLAKEEAKFGRQILKSDFPGVKLTKDQKETLASVVHENYEQLQQYDYQIKNMIPADKAKDLAKAYRMATKKGESQLDAMASSMMKAGLEENLQKKILGFNESKEELMQGIRDALTETLDDKQKEAMAKATMKMKQKAADKEKAKSST